MVHGQHGAKSLAYLHADGPVIYVTQLALIWHDRNPFCDFLLDQGF
jgi:hypothetical protein